MNIKETLESEIEYHKKQISIHAKEIGQMEKEISRFPEVILLTKHKQMRESLEIIKGNNKLIHYIECAIL